MLVGIDIGSITVKAILMSNNTVLDKRIDKVGYSAKEAATKIFNLLLKSNNLKTTDIKRIISTGYGRESIDFMDKTVSEIICHAKGVHFLISDAKTIIDIGGQDSKVIISGNDGKVLNFVMNDKCAAGTGRFLEVMARALDCSIEEFGNFALKGKKPSNISSICTVSAESEVISLVSKGKERNNIITGLHASISRRIVSMYMHLNGKPKVVLTGGVAKNIGVLKTLEEELLVNIFTHELSSFTGALGACLIAAQI